MASPLDDLRLPPLNLPKCAIVGCDEMPTEWLPGRATLPACKPHADMFRMDIAEKNYADFLRFLSDQGITDEPLLTDGQEVPATRKCCVPGCDGHVISGIGFAPFKQPSQAWVCKSHYDAANAVGRQQNGERLIRELESRPSQQSDPERLKRQRAIRAASGKHKGKPNYTENVCRQLQQQRIEMPNVGWTNLTERDCASSRPIGGKPTNRPSQRRGFKSTYPDLERFD
jgi:hypothetical protein